ncbi:MAG: helix-turn-helix transcriptional regulator [Desulfobacter sp.]|nr:helix-turn-helix transcriptional regulator [Desulfobacter sp.]WDP87871.1 MAG: helix-turn-helix transcriptional regulator [Desulfobacter sp.]
MNPFDFSIIRTLRMKRGITAEALAGRAKMTRATVAKLESGRGNPTIDTVSALGNVFGLTAAELIQMAETKEGEAGKTAPYEKDGLKGFRVGFSDFEIYHLTAEAGTKAVSEAGLHKNTAEICLVISGRIRVSLLDAVHDLGPGEAVRFKALQGHELDIISDSSFLLIHINPA